MKGICFSQAQVKLVLTSNYAIVYDDHREGIWWGVDIDNETICNTMDRGVWEPAASKVNSFSSATEAACMVLSIDETVRNPRSEGAEQGMQGGGRGFGRGAPMSAAMGGQGMRGMVGGGRGVRAYRGRGGR